MIIVGSFFMLFKINKMIWCRILLYSIIGPAQFRPETRPRYSPYPEVTGNYRSAVPLQAYNPRPAYSQAIAPQMRQNIPPYNPMQGKETCINILDQFHATFVYIVSTPTGYNPLIPTNS